MASNYLLAWSIYLGAVVVTLLLFWLLLRRAASPGIRRVLMLCGFAFLITPAQLEPGSDYWVPAFMAAMMEAIDHGLDAGLQRLWPMLLLMLGLLLVSLLWRLRHLVIRPRGDGSAPTSTP